MASAHGDLGQDELLRRLDALAHEAAKRIAAPGALSIRRISHSENTTYLLSDTVSGERKILRIHRTDYHSPTAIASELNWMEALREDAGIRTPRVLAGSDGECIHLVESDDVPDGRQCVFFEHLEGVEPSEVDLLASFPNLGEITARMHQHVHNWTAPVGFERFDWNVETVFGDAPHWGHWYQGPNLNDERRVLLGRMVDVMCARLGAFGIARERYGLIHADMRLANLLVHDGETRVIDFDDSGISWYLYDLAAALSFMEARPDVPELVAVWLEGYRRVLAVSQAEEDEVPTFLMLRRMLILAWMGTHGETDLARSLGDAFTDETCELAERYLGTFG